MRTGGDEEPAFEFAAGCVGVVAAAFVAALAFGPAEPLPRALVLAAAVGGLAAMLRDRRAVAGLTVIAALVFVGFLAHRAGQLTGDPAPWRCTPLLGLAALLGYGYRRIRTVRGPATAPRPRRSDRGHPYNAGGVSTGRY